MKTDCKIIQDILPLYAENMVSDETKAFVEEHIADCEACRGLLNTMKEPQDVPVTLSAAPLVHLKKKLLKKRIATVLFTATVVLVIAITGFAFLTAPQYIPYSNDVLSIEEKGGTIICTFSDEVTVNDVDFYISENGKTDVYHIKAWKTTFDEYTGRRGGQVFIDPTPGRQVAIYYSQNNGTEDILLYGVAPYGSGGVISLPRYVLGYYLILAIMASVVLAVLLLIVRKKPVVRLWIERVLLFPVSYVISHLCVMCAKGVLVATYSAQREFLFIMLIAILIYLAGLLGISIFRARKESRNI